MYGRGQEVKVNVRVSRPSVDGDMDREYIERFYKVTNLIAPGASGFFKIGSYF